MLNSLTRWTVLGFWRNLADVFALADKKVYITGVSYAGQYVPYIASAMLDSDDINLQGSMVYDPAISDDVPLVEGVLAYAARDGPARSSPLTRNFSSYPRLHRILAKCPQAELVLPGRGPAPARRGGLYGLLRRALPLPARGALPDGQQLGGLLVANPQPHQRRHGPAGALL